MKVQTLSSVKFKQLKNKLRIPLYQAVGILEALWLLTARKTPQGDIGKLSNDEIAAHIEYQSDADLLIQTLLDCRFLDASDKHRLLVHDWAHHMPIWVKGNLSSHGKPVF